MKNRFFDNVRDFIGIHEVLGRLTEIEKKISFAPQVRDEANSRSQYDIWIEGNVQSALPAPKAWLSSSFTPDSKYGSIINSAMMEAETLYHRDLLAIIKDEEIPGAIVEFGVFEGFWLDRICRACEEIQLNRPIYGFDSFEGLPTPSNDYDLTCWEEGQYAASLEAVRERLRCDQRKHISLVKGWFSDSLASPSVQEIKEIAYARVDCDLYHPSVEVLDYLTPRLVDGGILVFDDWTYDLEKGETKAFVEWLPQSGIHFEFLAYNSIGHFYLRARR